MPETIKDITFHLENQDGCGEDTIMHVNPTSSGKVAVSFGSETVPSFLVETYGEEIRILIYPPFEEEPDIIVLDAISGVY